MTTLDDLSAALAARDWPHALALAITAWREQRAPELADLVDRIGARCELPSPPLRTNDHHAWWMGLAGAYDPVTATALLAHVMTRIRGNNVRVDETIARWPVLQETIRARKWRFADDSANWVDRLAAILAWPDDPRVASLLAAWFTDLASNPPTWLHEHAMQELLAKRLAALADVRVLRQLSAYLGAYPEDPGRRSINSEAARYSRIENLRTALAQQTPPTLPDSLRARIAALAPTEIEELWQQLGARPDDRALRSVLADALIAARDSRGDAIALQLAVERDPSPAPARDPRLRTLRSLIPAQWDRWFGPVATIAVRTRSEFRGGMLEVLCAGQPSTPRWAWPAARDHRELYAVHTVRPFEVPEAEYAAFLTGLTHLRTLELASPHTAYALDAIGARLPITCLEYRHPQDELDRSRVPAALELMTRIAPDIQRIVLDSATSYPERGSIFTLFAALFPGREITTRSR